MLPPQPDSNCSQMMVEGGGRGGGGAELERGVVWDGFCCVVVVAFVVVEVFPGEPQHHPGHADATSRPQLLTGYGRGGGVWDDFCCPCC